MSKFAGTGPSSYKKKKIYRAAVSQRLRNTGLVKVDRGFLLMHRAVFKSWNSCWRSCFSPLLWSSWNLWVFSFPEQGSVSCLMKATVLAVEVSSWAPLFCQTFRWRNDSLLAGWCSFMCWAMAVDNTDSHIEWWRHRGGLVSPSCTVFGSRLRVVHALPNLATVWSVEFCVIGVLTLHSSDM